MTVVSQSKSRRSSANKSTDRKVGRIKPFQTGQKPAPTTFPGAAPQWAQDAIFNQARVVAWEGTVKPIRARSTFPSTGSFLDSILLVRKGGLIHWEESIHPLDQDRVRSRFVDIEKLPIEIEYRLVTTAGSIAWVRHSIIEKSRAGRRTVVRGFVKDIQTEKELELESLRVSEREQNRIGQDLHDDLCQVLAGVSCLMRVAEGRLASKVPEEVAGLSEINQQVIEAMHRTRALTHGLFPGKIQIADVRGALLELIAQVRARFQVEVKTAFKGRFPHHTANQTIQIYRLAQEAISNAIKHGHASCITIHLEAKPTTMFLSIIDNGTGLGQSESDEKGVGLHIMKYRASTLGGELDVRNAPKQGVVVSLKYPFQH
jgi:signal transduction histidine kinase